MPKQVTTRQQELEQNIGDFPDLDINDSVCLTFCRAVAGVHAALLRAIGGNVTSNVEHRPPLVLMFLLHDIFVDFISLDNEGMR